MSGPERASFPDGEGIAAAGCRFASRLTKLELSCGTPLHASDFMGVLVGLPAARHQARFCLR